jgi:hypothetical protein
VFALQWPVDVLDLVHADVCVRYVDVRESDVVVSLAFVAEELAVEFAS